MLGIQDLQFASQYAGLFWTAPNRAALLNDLAQQHPVSSWIYASSKLALAVVVADRHGEPVISFLRSAHELCQGASSIITGLVSGTTPQPPPKDAYLLRFRFDEFNAAMLTAVLSHKSVYILCAPDIRELIAIVPTATALELLRGFPAPAPVTGLELVYSTVPPNTPRRHSHQYDPIESQISEVVNRSSVAVREELSYLKQAWVTALGEEAPWEISEVEANIRQVATELGERLKNGPQSMNKDEWNRAMLSKVDRAASSIRYTSEQCERLRSVLADYSLVPSPWERPSSYAESARYIFLAAARKLTIELSDRCGIGDNIDILPAFIFSDFATFPIFDLRILEDRYRRNTGREHTVVSFPRTLRMRLGALPLVAHEIAHTFLRPLRSEIGVFAGSLLPMTKTLMPRDKDTLTSTREAELFSAEVAMSWALEVACDLAAIMSMGPAYLWSFLRFLTGTLHEFTNEGPRFSSRTHPPMAMRASLMLRCLEFIGVPVKVDSRFSIPPFDTPASRIFEIVRSKMNAPYSSKDHELAVGTVKEQLIHGTPCAAPPSVILNALWDGVVSSQGIYVNEVAAATAILGWPPILVSVALPPRLRTFD